MRIAVLSGKGGAGKTLVTVNLAAVAGPSVYVDCDVEEPNGHLYFNPKEKMIYPISVRIPVVNESRCTACRKCVEFCRFHSLALIEKKIMVFEDICHACGGCSLVCPTKAITEREKEIGRLEIGVSGETQVMSGIMNPGQAAGVPIIRGLLKKIPQNLPVFIDCPPGSACSVMESIKDADYCLLVTEPTIFGLHNLRMVHELVMVFGKPHGLLLNKCLDGINPSEVYAKEQGIPILGQIPYLQHIGDLHAKGKILVHEEIRFQELFRDLKEKLSQEVLHETASNTQWKRRDG